MPSRGQEATIVWTQVSDKNGANANLADLAESELFMFVPQTVHPNYPELDFEAVLVRSKCDKEGLKRLIAFPHGGPHSAFTCDFSHHVAIFYSLGYSVLLINYRGSSGFGQNSIDSLPGHISDYDVKDCQVIWPL